MSEKKILYTDNAPQPIGPYSQAIQITEPGALIFLSGQIGIDPATGKIAEDIEGQTRQVLKNIKAILEESGSSMSNVIKTTVFLKNMDHFAAMNAIYAEAFGDWAPARSAVEVARLPKDLLVEIEVIAHK